MTTWDIIESLCKKKGIKKAALERELGFSNGSLGKIADASKMQADRLQKIANYFGVSVDYLLTGNPGDEDVKIHIDNIMRSLDRKNSIIYEGNEVELTEENRRILRYALEIAANAAQTASKDDKQ